MRIPFWLFCGEDWIGYKDVSKDNIFRTFDLVRCYDLLTFISFRKKVFSMMLDFILSS